MDERPAAHLLVLDQRADLEQAQLQRVGLVAQGDHFGTDHVVDPFVSS